MKKILCYGDSNTYGYNPETGGRFDKNSRWSGILSQILEPDFTIIEEGMNNRTGFFKNPEGIKQSGSEYLSIFLQNNHDIDICILSLGTNDTQIFYNIDRETTKIHIQKLINDLKEANPQIKIIIIPPVKITTDILSSGFSILFNKNSITKIENIFPAFKETSVENNCYYFDFNEFCQPSKFDGLHYTTESHRIIADKLAKFITDNIE